MGPSCGIQLCYSLPRGRGRKDEMRSCFLRPFSQGGRNLAASCSWAGCRWKNKNAPNPLCKQLTCCSPAQTPHNCPLAFVKHFILASEGTSPPLESISEASRRPAPPAPQRRAPQLLPDQHENQHLLQDFIVFNGLLQVLQVGVDTADGTHVGLQQLNVPFLQQAGQSRVCKKQSMPQLPTMRPDPSTAAGGTHPCPSAQLLSQQLDDRGAEEQQSPGCTQLGLLCSRFLRPQCFSDVWCPSRRD